MTTNGGHTRFEFAQASIVLRMKVAEAVNSASSLFFSRLQ